MLATLRPFSMQAPQIAAWLKNRLSHAEDDWRRLLGAMYAHLMQQRVSELTDRAHIGRLLGEMIEAERLEDGARLVFRAGLRPAVREGRKDPEPVGRWIPAEAQARLADLIADEGLIDEVWVRELFAQKAAEELLSETLYQALKDFSTLVPRVLEKLLPSGLGKLAGFAANAGGKVFDEVERVLDGEIRRFLEKGTRKALDGAARFAAQNIDGPTAVDSRRSMVRFALGQSGQFHTRPATDARLDALEAVAVATARHVAERSETKTLIERCTDEIWTAYGPKTLGDALKELGIEGEPPLDAWAQATWPMLKRAIEAPDVQAWIDELAAEMVQAQP